MGSDNSLHLSRVGMFVLAVHYVVVVYTGMADKLDTSRWWFICVCVCPRTYRHIARRMMNG